MNTMPLELLKFVRKQREDQVFSGILDNLLSVAKNWDSLKDKDKLIVLKLVAWHNENRIFTTAQRGVIAGLYIKYEAYDVR